MPGTSTQNALRMLSVAPWFDDRTAMDLLGLAHFGGASAVNMIHGLRTAGLLHRSREVERIAEPARSEWREELHAEHEGLYLRALGVVAKHAREGLRDPLRSVLGADGAFLTTRVMDCVSSEEPAIAVEELVIHIEGRGNYDSVQAGIVADLISGYAFKRNRLADFFYGLSLWSSGRRAEALPYFDTVTSEDAPPDRPSCIARHLIGVALYHSGDLPGSRKMLERAISDLRALRDARGLEVTYCSYGRTLHALFRANRRDQDAAREFLVPAEQVLLEALRISTGLPGRRSRNLQYLASVVSDLGDHEAATNFANQACDIAEGPDRAFALATRGLTLRAAGADEAYLKSIRDACLVADEFGVSGRDLARLSNMAAAAERRGGNLVEGERLARSSIRMGEHERDSRHIGHAKHTLAAILIDRVFQRGDMRASEPERREIRELLEASRAALAALRDTQSVDLVDNTIATYSTLIGMRSDPPDRIAPEGANNP